MPVKVTPDAYDLLRELASFTARNGWASLGIERDDAPTQTALMEEAIKHLASRRTTSKGKVER